MIPIKGAIFLGLSLLVISFAACSPKSTVTPTPGLNQYHFDFVFNYGVGAKNQINTMNGKFTMDMVTDPSITTDLALSQEEMDSIYLEMKNIGILDYPDEYYPTSDVRRTPFTTYSIRIYIDGKDKDISWKDECMAETKEASELRSLFEKIIVMINNKDEYKKLPQPKSGYI